MEQRRLLIALAISLILIVAYQELVLSRYRKPEPLARKPIPAEGSAPATQPSNPQSPGELAVPPGERGLVSVDTDLLHVLITPVGARLADVQLKGYRRTLNPDSEPLDLVRSVPRILAAADHNADTFTSPAHGLVTGDGPYTLAGTDLPDGLDTTTVYWVIRAGADTIKLADSPAHAAAGIAVDFATDGRPGDWRLDSVPVLPATIQLGEARNDAGLTYRPDRSQLSVHGDDAGEVVLVADSPAGLHLEKRYRFTGQSYLFEVSAAVSGGNGETRNIGLILTPPPTESPNPPPQGVALAGRRLIEKPLRDLLKQPVSIDTSSWAGFSAKYFLAVGMPAEGQSSAVMTADGGMPIVRVEAPVTGGQAAFAVYAGPKDRDVLARAGHDLERALDFGMFWFVAVPLLRALRVLHMVTGNYGIAIIVLTALVKVLTAPLTQTTFKNMREMQKIQPQMTKLRERFKDDQVALQKEMMELYRRHRVNPFSGCVPMLLQLPIFVGLYNALSHAIELRHAPFALWINDLSAPDRLVIAGVPVPVLTLLMGASMFLQQWLTPQQGDPAQQRMMMFMPLVFTFMFINFPAGLVLYWLVNNLLTIGQQYLMMRSTT